MCAGEWFFMLIFLVFISESVHACSKQVHKCKLHTDILKIPSRSRRWASKFICSDWLKFSELRWKNRNLLFHEIMFPNNFSLLSEQFSLSDQVTAESCCFSFLFVLAKLKTCLPTCALEHMYIASWGSIAFLCSWICIVGISTWNQRNWQKINTGVVMDQ